MTYEKEEFVELLFFIYQILVRTLECQLSVYFTQTQMLLLIGLVMLYPDCF